MSRGYVIGATIKIDGRAGRRVAAVDLNGRIVGDAGVPETLKLSVAFEATVPVLRHRLCY